MRVMTKIFASAALYGLSLFLGSPGPAFAQEDAKGIVADRVREQGHECVNPVSAEEKSDESGPDFKVWILTCENTTYWVKLREDMEAEIKTVE